MREKFLKESVVVVLGKQFEPIAKLLDSKKHINEFIISKKLDITINQVRNLLYKLSDQGLVSSLRKKDKKKGWYTYFWRLEPLKCFLFLEEILKKRIEQLNYQIKSRETKVFYICETCNKEFTEENAILHDFTCDECGNIFTLRDNAPILRDFKKNLNKLQEELELVRKEIEIEKGALDKVKLKEEKKLNKIKEKEKQKKAKERAKERETKKANLKKVAVKKTKKKIIIKKKKVKAKTGKISKSKKINLKKKPKKR